MRKQIMSLLLVFVLCFSVPVASASDTRGIIRRPNLKINGTTAYCDVNYRTGDSDTQISVTLTLKQGSTTVDSWSDSGKGFVIISETATVQTGKTYDLVMNSTVNGKPQPEVTVSARS